MDPTCPKCGEMLFVVERPLGGYTSVCLRCGFKRPDPPVDREVASRVANARERIIGGGGNGADTSRQGG